MIEKYLKTCILEYFNNCKNLYFIMRSSGGIMVNVLDCDIVVSEFEPQSLY